MPFDSRVAIATGETDSIGSTMVTHLASLGAKVVIAYIDDPSSAHHLVSTFDDKPRALAVEADVSIASQVTS